MPCQFHKRIKHEFSDSSQNVVVSGETFTRRGSLLRPSGKRFLGSQHIMLYAASRWWLVEFNTSWWLESCGWNWEGHSLQWGSPLSSPLPAPLLHCFAFSQLSRQPHQLLKPSRKRSAVLPSPSRSCVVWRAPGLGPQADSHTWQQWARRPLSFLWWQPAAKSAQLKNSAISNKRKQSRIQRQVTQWLTAQKTSLILCDFKSSNYSTHAETQLVLDPKSQKDRGERPDFSDKGIRRSNGWKHELDIQLQNQTLLPTVRIMNHEMLHCRSKDESFGQSSAQVNSVLMTPLALLPSPARGEAELLLGVLNPQICIKILVSHASWLWPALCKLGDIWYPSETPEISQSWRHYWTPPLTHQRSQGFIHSFQVFYQSIFMCFAAK